MKTRLLGIDVGTSGIKALLMSKSGGVVGEAFEPYPVYRPKPMWSEQLPDDWWRAAVKAIKKVFAGPGARPEALAGIGLTGQMHGLVLLDAKGRTVRPCIMWNDQRTVAECAYITRVIGRDRLLAINGKPALTGFTAGKLIWVRRHEPGLFRKAAHLLLPKDYIRYRLSGAFCTDVADASGTNLFDLRRRTWSEELMAKTGIPASLLPEVSECVSVSSRVSKIGGRQTGLLPGTPVVSGAGDQAAQALGSAATRPGIVSITIGTSGVVFITTPEYCYDPQGRLHAYCHAVPGMWHLMGVMLAAGGSLRWFRDALGAAAGAGNRMKNADPYGRIIRQCARVPAGAEGLIFLPYLSGERTPYADPGARGVFFGLTMHHGASHMARAVLEGVGFGLRDGLELVKSMRLRINRIHVTGGGARSRIWCQILADILNRELTNLKFNQGAAFGAAVIAGVGTGVFSTVESVCADLVLPDRTFKPGDDTGLYERQYRVYRSLYPRLKRSFNDLSGLDRT